MHGSPSRRVSQTDIRQASGFGGETDFLDQRTPAVKLQFLAARHVFRAATKWDQSHHRQRINDGFVLDREVDRGIGCGNNSRRGFRRRVKTEPLFDGQVGKALLGL